MLKPEMLQRGGAFKFRGAYNFIAGCAGGTRAWRHRAVVRQPRASGRAGGEAVRSAGDGRHADDGHGGQAGRCRTAGCTRGAGRHDDEGPDGSRASNWWSTEGADARSAISTTRGSSPGRGPSGSRSSKICPSGHGAGARRWRRIERRGRRRGKADAARMRASSAWSRRARPKLTRAREAGAPVTLDGTHSIADGLMAIRIGTSSTSRTTRRILDDVVTVDDDAIERRDALPAGSRQARGRAERRDHGRRRCWTEP